MNRDVVRRLVIALVVVACIAGLALAVGRTRSGEEEPVESGDGNEVELVVPADGSQVLRQTPIGIDLMPTWVVVALEIGGVLIPEDQWDEEPALNQVFFTPGEGKEIEELEPGRTCVRASYRRVDQPSAPLRTKPWCFDVD